MKAENKDSNGLYAAKFEDRIHKHKLPKGLSYVLQTTDITEVLDTDGLALSYHYDADNPKKVKKLLVKDFSFTNVNLLSYHKREHRWGEPGSLLDYNRYMSIYCVPAKLRWPLRAILRSDVLPRLKALESRQTLNLTVYYRVFDRSSYNLLDRGGLYIESDRYNDKAKVLYRNTEFDLDKEIRECVI